MIALQAMDLAIAASLLLVHGVLSIWLRLGLEKPLVIASIRMVLQLGLLGLILKYLFAVQSPFLTGLVCLVMVVFAGREALARLKVKPQGLGWRLGLGAGSMATASILVTAFALTTQVRPDPWYNAQYAVPLLGMLLGNAMNGVSLGLGSFLTAVKDKRAVIEARLIRGEGRKDALQLATVEAFRVGLTPIINSMSATGLVFIPGMMTGQILAGAEPMQAVAYQLLIMFLIAGGTALGLSSAILLARYYVLDERLRLKRLL